MFTDIENEYLFADLPTREALLRQLTSTRSYSPRLSHLIAKEDLPFIVPVAQFLMNESRHLFLNLLCLVAKEKGLDSTIDLVEATGFLSTIPPSDPRIVGRYVTDDNNPLYALYQQEGAPLFFELYDRVLVDFSEMYLWVRSEPNPSHEQLFLSFLRHYEQDPVICPSLVNEMFRVERRIALSQNRPWHLSGYSNILRQISEAISPDNFETALSLIRAEIACSSAPSIVNVAEELVYIDFLRHISRARLWSDNLTTRYWRWLASAEGRLALQELDKSINS